MDENDFCAEPAVLPSASGRGDAGNKISVIVPIYQTEAYICKCIDSICNQTYRNLEIILVDNGSTDRCGKICDMYAGKDARIKVLHFDHNRGIGPALNAGLDLATGNWILIVDSDDWIDPDICEFLLTEVLHCGADIGISGYYAEFVDRHHQESGTPDWTERELLETNEVLERLLRDERLNSDWGRLYRADLFQGLRFPEEARFPDAAAAYHILKKVRKAALFPEEKYHYVQRDGSILHTLTLVNPVNLFQIYKRRFYDMQKQYPQFRDLLLERCAAYATVIWRDYYRYPREERGAYRAQLTEIAAFMKDHYRMSPQYLNGGGRTKFRLWLTQHAKRWSFLLAALLNLDWKLADKLLPKGSVRRKICKKIYQNMRAA